MAKITSRNNNLLRDSRNKVSPKVYDLLIELVNEDREDLAEMALKIDYLIEYANSAIKGKDFSEALETIQRAEERLKMIKRANFDVSHLEYLIEGVISEGHGRALLSINEANLQCEVVTSLSFLLLLSFFSSITSFFLVIS